MSDKWKWFRVSEKHRCRVCNSVQWCTFSPENSCYCCMRIESKKPAGNGGYLHFFTDDIKPTFIERRDPQPTEFVDFLSMITEMQEKTLPEWIDSFAKQLNVSATSLQDLGCAWSRRFRAWGFPMFDGLGNIIGIRLRTQDGHKFAVKSSHQGIFLPRCAPQKEVFIPEGPTSTAALLSLGLYAIGRPACRGSEEQVRQTMRRLQIRRAIIIGDNDTRKMAGSRSFYPGQEGAAAFASRLGLPCCVWTPPTKDCRDLIQFGADKAFIESAVRDLVWHAKR